MTNTNMTSTDKKSKRVNSNNTANKKQPITTAQTVQAFSQPQSIKSVPKPDPNIPIRVSIADHSYTISCPASEKSELQAATAYINTFIDDLRKQAPQLTHENLLVLCCLNLYGDLKVAESNNQSSAQREKIAHDMVDKMLGAMQPNK